MKKLNVDWLFSAQCNGELVVVKFVRTSYGKVVHEFLARHNLAPKLFSVSPLPGGWLAVVMEKVEGVPISTPSSVIKESLRTAIQLMHDQGYVHGDLRPQNILVVADRVCITYSTDLWHIPIPGVPACPGSPKCAFSKAEPTTLSTNNE